MLHLLIQLEVISESYELVSYPEAILYKMHVEKKILVLKHLKKYEDF